jgi:hypothetical protein
MVGTLSCPKAWHWNWMAKWKCILPQGVCDFSVELREVLCCKDVLIYSDEGLFYKHVGSFPFETSGTLDFCYDSVHVIMLSLPAGSKQTCQSEESLRACSPHHNTRSQHERVVWPCFLNAPSRHKNTRHLHTAQAWPSVLPTQACLVNICQLPAVLSIFIVLLTNETKANFGPSYARLATLLKCMNTVINVISFLCSSSFIDQKTTAWRTECVLQINS